MTTVVTAAGAAQFLSLAPRLLGFTPVESLVVVPLCRGRSVGALRIDLPEEADADRAAVTVIGMVCRIPEADALAAVVYTQAACAGGLPRAELAGALAIRADECGVEVVDVLCVAAAGWGSYLDPDCPADGRPLAEITAADDEALPAPVGDQRGGTELPVVASVERSAVAAALAEIDRAVPLLCGGSGRSGPRRVDPRALEAACDLDDLPRLFDDALDRADDVDGYAAAVLVWCLARPALRDIALVGWARGIDAGDAALGAQLGWERGEEYPESLARIVWGDGPRPASERLRRALGLCRRVAALAPEAERAGPLAVCGWLSWALGRSTHAERYALAALDADPDNGFAGIVRSFVGAGHLPAWAFRPAAGRSAPGDSFRRLPQTSAT